MIGLILPIKDSNFGGFIGQSYLKITLEPIRIQNLGSLLMKLSQSNLNLQSPDSDSVRRYLIATVLNYFLGACEVLSCRTIRKILKTTMQNVSTYIVLILLQNSKNSLSKTKCFGHFLFFRDCCLNPKNSDDFEITCKTNTLKKPTFTKTIFTLEMKNMWFAFTWLGLQLLWHFRVFWGLFILIGWLFKFFHVFWHCLHTWHRNP